jgi:hypothetical protein
VFKRIGDRMENIMKKWLIKLSAALLLWLGVPPASAQNVPILNMGFSGAGIGSDLLKVIERNGPGASMASTCAQFTFLVEA